jgi:hypothetical protein
MRSKESALISTPAPKPMISPIARKLILKRSAKMAPITSDEAASVPQPKEAAIRTVPRAWLAPLALAGLSS